MHRPGRAAHAWARPEAKRRIETGRRVEVRIYACVEGALKYCFAAVKREDRLSHAGLGGILGVHMEIISMENNIPLRISNIKVAEDRQLFKRKM